ncbi:MAG: hypothetical protein SF187_05005 [Deltaproteobacteria bacterium]|nr:hypothetical protein [Deltaproteobacteria bacterium]
MINQRKLLFAVMAWVLPLVMLASWSAQAAGMFCRAEGAVVRSGCCCGADTNIKPIMPLPDAELSDAGCCEVTASQAPVAVPMAPPVLKSVPPVLAVLCARLLVPEPAVVPPGGWSRAEAPRAQGQPLTLLKHAFLI